MSNVTPLITRSHRGLCLSEPRVSPEVTTPVEQLLHAMDALECVLGVRYRGREFNSLNLTRLIRNQNPR